MHIMIAVDDQPESTDAVATATAMFGPDHRYTFVSIAAYVSPETARSVGTPSEVIELRQVMLDRSIARAEGTITEAASSTADGIDLDDVDAAVDFGDVGPAICELAATEGADLLVLGSRDRNLWDRIFHPSVGRHVIDHAPCPVLVVR